MQKKPNEVKEPEDAEEIEQGRSNFPRYGLKESLRIAQVIWDKFAGRSASLLDLAEQLEYAPKTTNFKYLLRASSRYGLTQGVWNRDLSTKISLTSLGKSIVAPSMSDDVNASLRRALENPPLFKRLYQELKGAIIPPDTILTNTLIRDYSLSRSDAEQFLKVFRQNVADYNLAKDFQGKQYFNMDGLSSVEPVKQLDETPVDDDEQETTEPAELAKQPVPVPEVKQQAEPRVFISHSKNKRIVEQIKQMLTFGKFQYEIAEERETTAIPISDKVFGLMRKCNCAIINVSADEEKKRPDGTYAMNENVLIEIGGAFLHYDRRVILLVDRRFKDELPSNIRGLYMSFYDGDELSWETGMKLQEALTEFRSKL